MKWKGQSLGEQELEMLRFIADNGPIAVGEAAKNYGVQKGLARTTVLTMMERLRGKGFLARKQVEGVYRYSVKVDHGDLLVKVVGDFVQRSLGGSLSPFVAYLVDSGKLSEKEIAVLRSMIEGLEAGEGNGS